MIRRLLSVLLAACAALSIVTPAWAAGAAQDPSAQPRVLLDQPLRMVEYQISRLTADELSRVERKPDDPKYRPIYAALLVRTGIPGAVRDEALAALTGLDRLSPVRVLLDALGRVAADDAPTEDKLLGTLLGQPVAALKQDRDALVQAIDQGRPSLVLRGAYGGLMVADGAVDSAWQLALAHAGQMADLLRSVRHLPAGPAGDTLRTKLFDPIAALTAQPGEALLRADAFDAIGWTTRDDATFALLAREITTGTDAAVKAAAIRSMLRVPEATRTASQIEPIALAIVAFVKAIPADRRTDPQAIDALQLGDRLSSVLPDPARRTVRRDLRALGVQVVHIETIVEEMSFDQWWFAVEAGKPVQIVFTNREAMPHNMVIGTPGSLEDIGNAGAAVPLPVDPAVKPYVPDSPLVLQSTNLLKEGETARLNFPAPTTPGDYVFLCTFPGHWVRMYGVMLVVNDLEAWEAAPKPPVDPMTRRPFTAKRH